MADSRDCSWSPLTDQLVLAVPLCPLAPQLTALLRASVLLGCWPPCQEVLQLCVHVAFGSAFVHITMQVGLISHSNSLAGLAHPGGCAKHQGAEK